MPAWSEPERDYHRPGDFSDTSLEAVRKRLAEYPFCIFHPGFMPATFDQLDDQTTFSFVHVDVDIYPSALACCEWFWPKMVPGATMVFDDYGFYAYRSGIRAAVDEFFAQQDILPVVLPTGQALVSKV